MGSIPYVIYDSHARYTLATLACLRHVPDVPASFPLFAIFYGVFYLYISVSRYLCLTDVLETQPPNASPDDTGTLTSLLPLFYDLGHHSSFHECNQEGSGYSKS